MKPSFEFHESLKNRGLYPTSVDECSDGVFFAFILCKNKCAIDFYDNGDLIVAAKSKNGMIEVHELHYPEDSGRAIEILLNAKAE